MQAALEAKTFVTSQRMLDWQYAQILAELGQLQLHAGDPTCPCRLSKELGENCLAKHSLMVSSLAAETAAMDSAHFEMMMDLSAEAKEKHEDMKAFLCDKKDEPEFLAWSRQWRKKIEPFYYHGSCKLSLKQEATCTLKEPWRIMRDEFVRQRTEETKRGYSGSRGLMPDLNDKWMDTTKYIHRQYVEDALSEGEHVPAEVLKDYPDLQRGATMYEGDPLLKTIHAELCPGVIPCLLTDRKPKLPVCNAEEGKRLEDCILDVKESNRETGCKEGARSSKHCPNPFAVCRSSIGCRLGRAKERVA